MKKYFFKCTLFVIAFFLIACSSSNEEEEPPKPDTIFDLTIQNFEPKIGNREYGVLSGLQPYPIDSKALTSGEGVSNVAFNLYKDNYHLGYIRGQIPDELYQCVSFAIAGLVDLEVCRKEIAKYLEKSDNMAKNYIDERNYLTIAVNPEYDAFVFTTNNPVSIIPKYEHKINQTLKAGDKLRVFTYIHNAARDGSNLIGKNTTITFNWENKDKITCKIYASNASLSSSINGAIFDTVELSLPDGLTLKPVKMWIQRYYLSANESVTDGRQEIPITQSIDLKEYKYDIGEVKQHYSGARGYYLDLVVE